MKRPFSILLVLLLLLPLSSALAAKSKATPTPAPVQITEEVVEEVPEKIQYMLDIAYTEWETLEGKKLKKSNKYTNGGITMSGAGVPALSPGACWKRRSRRSWRKTS